MTNSQRMRESAVMISSTMPSAKYSCSGAPLIFWNGSTAVDGLSGSASGEFAAALVVSSDRSGFSASRMRWTRIGRADILDLLLAHVLKREGELVAYLV